MANPKDEFERQQQAVAQTGQVKSLAASTDPANAGRLAKVPAGIGGNPIAATSAPAAPPAPAVQPQSNAITQTAASAPSATPPMRSASSPSNTYPQSSPSVGANVYGGAGFSGDQFGSSGKFAQVPPGIGGNPGRPPSPSVMSSPAPAAPQGMSAGERATAIGQIPTGGVASPARQATAASAPAGPAPALDAQAASDRAKFGAAWDTAKDVGGDAFRALADVALLAPRGVAGAYDSAVVRPLRAAGVNANYISSGLVPEGVDPSSMTPFTDQKRMQQASGASAQAAAAGQAVAAPWDQSKLAGALGGLDKEMAAQSRVASVLNPDAAAPGASVAANPMADWNRTGMSNAQVGELNPAGRVTMTRQANGTMAFSGGDVSGPVSYMDGGGNPLAGGGVRGNGFSRVDSAPAGVNVAMGPNGSFAYASGNPIAAAGQPSRASAGSSASGAVDSAVAAAAQRGDWDAVGAHYAGRGQDFGGQSASQIRQAQSGPQGAVIGGSTFGFDPAARNAQFDRDQLNRTIMDPNTKRSMRQAITSLAQTDAQSASSAQRMASDERRSAASNEAAVEQTAMREQGEDFRAGNRNRLAAAELAQRYSDTASQNQIRQLEANRAQRTANILDRYDNAKDEAERESIVRQYPDAFGMTTADPVGKDRFMTVGGGTSVVDGQTVRDPVRIFDTVTQQEVGGAGQGKQSIESNPQAIAIRDNPKLSWEQKAAELKKLGY